jgi:PilZ domain-containing protein
MRKQGRVERSARVVTNFDAVLIDSDGGRLDVIVTDISRGGFRLQTTETLAIGEDVCLEVPKYGAFSAQIRWAVGLSAGGVFLEPVQLPTAW